MAETPKNCCSLKPQLFRDTKIGHTVEKFVVTCGNCGKFSDDVDRSKAIWKWNNGFRERNPIDRDFVNKLERAKR